MALNQIVLGPPPPPPSGEEASSSSSPTSSGISDSPRDSSVAVSLVRSPTSRYGVSEELDDMSVSPKLEDADDVFSPGPVLKTEPGEASTGALAVGPIKRPRGRPRKHPKPEQAQSPKITKGRSKTGCYTCRKRKKKCDERKPECKNCEQNNVQCEGYPPRTAWQSGRQKALTRNRRRWAEQGPAPLPPFIPGIENELDWKFYQHYNEMLSRKLQLSPENNNPFVVHLLPMAQTHKGLMHAILACSGSHLLTNLRSVLSDDMVERQSYHWSEAVKAFCNDEEVQLNGPSIQSIAQAVVHQLQTIVEGNSEGQWRTHGGAVRDMLNYKPSADEEGAYSFFAEFFRYHEMSTFLTSADPVTVPDEELPKYFQFATGNGDNFMSVCEGLDVMTRKIHNLRGRVRERRLQGLEPFVPYNIMDEGRLLSQELERIQCRHVINCPEWICWQLYRVCIFLYLQRSIMTSKTPGPNIKSAVGQGIEYLQGLTSESPIQSLVLLPLFILGCCAWWQEDRPAIVDALNVCENYSQNGNIKHARDILHRLWDMMDDNDSRVWDYEDIMKNDMGMDLLLT